MKYFSFLLLTVGFNLSFFCSPKETAMKETIITASQMDSEVEQLWNNLIQSVTLEKEAVNTEILKRWIQKNEASLSITIVDKEKKAVSWNVFDFEHTMVESININFQWKGEFYEATGWMPKHLDHFFLLLQE